MTHWWSLWTVQQKKLTLYILASLSSSLPYSNVPNDAQPDSHSSNSISTESVLLLTTSVCNEKREREKREPNIILHNIPEPTASESDANQGYQISSVRRRFGICSPSHYTSLFLLCRCSLPCSYPLAVVLIPLL